MRAAKEFYKTTRRRTLIKFKCASCIRPAPIDRRKIKILRATRICRMCGATPDKFKPARIKLNPSYRYIAICLGFKFRAGSDLNLSRYAKG